MGLESDEDSGPAREARNALVSGKVEHDMAGRGVATRVE